MDKTTVIGNIQFSVSLSEQAQSWMEFHYPEAWFSQENGDAFLQKFGEEWWASIEPLIAKDIQQLFLNAGLPEENLPEIALPGQTRRAQATQNPKKVRIAVARDNAFCFYYTDNLELLERHGAELVFFSPMADRDIPENIDGLYFGGGYPELFAAKLAENTALGKRVKEKSADGMPIYGECGGFMYLCDELIDLNNHRYRMSGCFPFATRMFARLKALGYREVTLTRNTVIGHSGMTRLMHRSQSSTRR